MDNNNFVEGKCKKPSKSKLVVITNGNFFARIILNDLLNRSKYDIAGILIIVGDYRADSGLKSIIKIFKSTTFPYFFYKVMIIILYKIIQLFNMKSSYSVEKLCKLNSISFHKEISVNSDSSLNWVIEKQPDLLVSVSCPQKISNRMLNSAKLGGINIHSSLLPNYAGLAPYFWVLSQGEKVTGTTVHYMTQIFDEGNILIQKELPIKNKESCHSLFLRLSRLGSEALIEGVNLVFLGNTGIKQNMDNYSYFSNPTFEAYTRLKKNGHCLFKVADIKNNFI